MLALKEYRDAVRKLSASSVGLAYRQPYLTAAQQKAVRHASELMSLPGDSDSYAAIQVTDPADPGFGQPLFMLGLDGLGLTRLGG